jgi:predicted dehydrogenase
MHNKVRKLGIVGFGSIGRKHYKVARALYPDLEIHLVRPVSKQRPLNIENSTKVFSRTDELIAEGVDAAIVCTPAPSHLESFSELIRGGIPMLLEKPMTHNLESASRLLELATKHPETPVVLGYVLRHSLVARKFKDQLDTGSIGELLFASIECSSYLPNWRPSEDYRMSVSARAEMGGGVLLELSHELDYANWFFGGFSSIYSTHRNTETLQIDVEDLAEIILKNQNGLTVRLHLDFCSRETLRQCSAFGSNGSLVANFIDGTVRTTISGITSVQQVANRAEEPDAMYFDQLRHFFKCVECGLSPSVTVSDGFWVLRMIDAARESNRNGKAIAL